MYIQDTIYFTCINVEESRNLVQNFATCPWRVNRKTKSRNGAKFTKNQLYRLRVVFRWFDLCRFRKKLIVLSR